MSSYKVQVTVNSKVYWIHYFATNAAFALIQAELEYGKEAVSAVMPWVML